MAFSLGTVVAINVLVCLHHLYNLGFSRAGRILDSVYLLGGAAIIDIQKNYERRLELAKKFGIVSGKVINCHSEKDELLNYAFPSMLHSTIPIGKAPILTDIPEDQDGTIKCKKVININNTKEAHSHTQQKNNAYLFWHKVPNHFR